MLLKLSSHNQEGTFTCVCPEQNGLLQMDPPPDPVALEGDVLELPVSVSDIVLWS